MSTDRHSQQFDWKKQFALFVVLVLLAAVIRTWNVDYAAPWNDEMHSITYAQNTIEHLSNFSRKTDIHPPLYFLSLKGWFGLFGETREAARSLSVVLGTACVAMIFIITRLLFTLRTAVMATAFIATFPTAVHYAREIRMYPLFSLLFLISLYFYLKLMQELRKDTPLKKRQIAYLTGFIIPLTLTFYTHYTSALLFGLYTIFALALLIMADRRGFIWTVGGLAVATLLTLPQVYHLMASSLGDPRKDWMEPTTLTLFYQTTLGAFNYPTLVKPLILLAIISGCILMLIRDRERAVLLIVFSAGGMFLAALIGVYEPIYLVRTIQVFTFATAIFVAYLIVWMPARVGTVSILVLMAINIATVARNEYLPEREQLGVEAMQPMIEIIDRDRDAVFSKDYIYLRREAQFLNLDFYDYARPVTLAGADEEPIQIEAALETCFAAAGSTCRSVILILEEEAQFEREASDTWNAYADDIRARFPNTLEYLGGGLRAIIVSRDAGFLNQTRQALTGS